MILALGFPTRLQEAPRSNRGGALIFFGRFKALSFWSPCPSTGVLVFGVLRILKPFCTEIVRELGQLHTAVTDLLANQRLQSLAYEPHFHFKFEIDQSTCTTERLCSSRLPFSMIMETSQYVYRAFPGSAAYSDFRLKRLAAAIGAQDLQAIWVHYVASYQELTSDQVTVLDQLLEYGSFPQATEPLYPQLLQAVVTGASQNDEGIAFFYVTPPTRNYLAMEFKGDKHCTCLWFGEDRASNRERRRSRCKIRFLLSWPGHPSGRAPRPYDGELRHFTSRS